jgi:signal peptidase I
MDRTDPPASDPQPPADPPEDAGGLTGTRRAEMLGGGEPNPGPPQQPASDAPTPAPPAPTPPPLAPPPGRRHASSTRLLLTLAGGFLGGFLFLRTVFIEPFGVPTGSMAPTLIGNHREAPCPRCGYPVRVGTPSSGDAPRHFTGLTCPNCGQPRIDLTQARELNGDRLLVDKNVYSLRRPRRWEVAVFRCPADLSKPYVKRVVGLPGEVITLADGDAYANNELLRKGLAEVREARVLVLDMAYAPKGGGWAPRWLIDPSGSDPRLPAVSRRPAATADESVVRDGAIVLDAAASPQAMVGLTYRHWNLDEKQEEPVRVWSSYDGPPRSFGGLPAAHDFSIECEVEVTAAAGEGSFACRLFDGADAVNAELTVGPRSAGRVHLTHEGKGGLAAARGVSLVSGRSYRLEFAFVDRRATLALDGKVVVAPADLPANAKRGEVRRPLQFGARGCRVVVRNLKLHRDIHYLATGVHGNRQPAKLGPDEYFVLGDNSGNSQDSREWARPGVPEADFIGKPFLIHQPLRLGRVTLAGRERVYQTLDWSRLRWLH